MCVGCENYVFEDFTSQEEVEEQQEEESGRFKFQVIASSTFHYCMLLCRHTTVFTERMVHSWE